MRNVIIKLPASLASPLMSFVILRRPAVVALVVLGVAVSIHAQEPRRLNQPDSIPLELATALISSGGLPGDPQILVGSLPGWMTNRVYIAPTARVVGSAFIGTTAVAIVSSPEMPDVAMAALKRELAARGWKTPPPQPSFGGGFRSATMNMTGGDLTRAILCGADNQLLTATASRRRGVSTDIVMRIATYTGNGTCTPREVPPEFRRSPWPTLYHPAGVSENPQACNVENGFGSNGTGAIVRSSIGSDSLLDHYAKQLRDSGWQSPGSAGSIVGRTWTKTDSTGGPVELTITAASSPRDPMCRTLNMSVRTLRKP
jgi:hypothetical protein